jgi:type VI secretion system secreted protein VgrG
LANPNRNVSIPLVEHSVRVETRGGQGSRPTVLDEGIWHVRRIVFEEELSRPYQLQLGLITEEVGLEPDVLLGADLELRCTRGDDERRIHGVVHRIRNLGTFSHRLHLQLDVSPALSLLGLSLQSRIFQSKTVPEIVEEVAKGSLASLGRKLDRSRLARTYGERDYCVQLRETDLAFIERILAEEGIGYVFEHEHDAETLVLVDGNHTFPSVGGSILEDGADGGPPLIVPVITTRSEQADTESIDRFEWMRQAQTANVEISAWDWKASRPDRLIGSERRQPGPEPWEVGERFMHDPGRLVEQGDGTGPHVDPTPILALLARERIDAASRAATGTGNVLGFGPGRCFELSGHPHAPYDAEYLLTRVVHRADCPEADVHAHPALAGPNYENRFECIPRGLAWRPRLQPKPQIHGCHIATVVGPPGEEIHVDEHGRIKVRFPWDRDGPQREPDTSCWLRVAQPWAGPGWGTVFIPRVGMEVLVTFIDGDPDRPLCIGSVYNGRNHPPYAPLPDHKTKSTIRSSSSPGGEGSNELTFEDAAGREEVYLHAQRNLREVVGAAHSLRVGAGQSESVGRDQTITVGRDRSVTITGNEMVTVKGQREGPGFAGHKMEVTGDHHVTATKHAHLSAPESISLVCLGTKIELTPQRITLRAGSGATLVLDVEALMASATHAKVRLDAVGHVEVSSNAPATMSLAAGVKLASSAGSELVLDGAARMVAAGAAAELQLTSNVNVRGEEVTCQSRAAMLEMTTDATLSANTVTLQGAAGMFEAGPQGATTTGASVTTQAAGTATVLGKLVKIN